MLDSSEAPPVANLVGGNWLNPAVENYTPVHNPSTGEVIACSPSCGPREVESAVLAARDALAGWSRLPVFRRVAVLQKFRQLLEDEFESLSALITRENGKTLEESRGDVRRGIEVVELACGAPSLLKGEALPQIADGIDGETTREPLGVCAGITPFNFPAMVPLWMFPIALASGNCFILKPSEKTPLTAVRLGELLQEAGLPPGVFSIVHGGREAVQALCEHPGIAAISFVGSSGVARDVYRAGCAAGKRVQAAGGAKNMMVVMPDADPDATLRAIMGAAYGCAGQRCMAGSLLLGVGEAADEMRRRVVQAAERLKVADTSHETDADMGPLIDGDARARVLCDIAAAPARGATLALDGRQRQLDRGFFVGPTLLDHVTPDSPLFGRELFGPVLGLMRPRTLDEAIDWMQLNGYGNGGVIFTSSGGAARQFMREAPCGMIGVNVGVPAPMAVFSFSGWNDSFYGDLHVQGTEGFLFYTRQKMTLSRWDSSYRRQQGW